MSERNSTSPFMKERRRQARPRSNALSYVEFDQLTDVVRALRRSGDFEADEVPIPRLESAIASGYRHARGVLSHEGTESLIRDLRHCVRRLRARGMEAAAETVAVLAQMAEKWDKVPRVNMTIGRARRA